jgi:hypothetical protein
MSIKFFGLVVLLVVTICKDLTAVTDTQSETIGPVLMATVSDASDTFLGDIDASPATAFSLADGIPSGAFLYKKVNING